MAPRITHAAELGLCFPQGGLGVLAAGSGGRRASAWCSDHAGFWARCQPHPVCRSETQAGQGLQPPAAPPRGLTHLLGSL